MTTYSTLELAQDGDVLWVNLARPNKLNAVSRTMMDDLLQLCLALENDQDTKFVVFGAQGRLFSAGADLDELIEQLATPEKAEFNSRSMQRQAQRTLAALENLEQVTIGMIHGAAIGAGFAIASVFDFRIMAENSYIGLPETERGLYLSYACTPRLVDSLGLSKAKEVIMFAKNLSALECLEAGLANRVVTEDDLISTATAMVKELQDKNWSAIRITKILANAVSTPHLGNVALGETELAGGALTTGGPLGNLQNFRR